MFFRHSEVISAGNIFSTVSYPVIDVEKGGSIQGVIAGLNKILDLAVAEYRSQGGTFVIPGRGRLSDAADVASYRNMVVMIRDRVKDMVGKNMTLEQIKAAKPTMDFDGRYGSTTGAWTTDMFVEACIAASRRRRMRKTFFSSSRSPVAGDCGIRPPFLRRDLRHQQEVRVKGKLVQFVFRNPHSFVHVEARTRTA